MLSAINMTLRAGDKLLCADFNIEISPGQSWAILGLNGTGKTTLLHTLAGLLPQQGQVELNQRALNDWSRQELARHIGLLLQKHQDPFPGSVIEYVMIGRHPYLGHFHWESEADLQIAQQALDMVGLTGFEQRDIQHLSGGEYQRMMIAMVMVQQPAFYLLDEPVNHLDWPHQHELLTQLNRLVKQQSKSLIMALHDVNLAAQYSDHVIMLFEDADYLSGPTDELLDRENLERLYKTPIHEIMDNGKKVFLPAG